MSDPIAPGPVAERVRADGKFFRAGPGRFYVRGLTYGPFAPDPAGRPYPGRDQVRRDLEQVAAVGANVLRVYDVPPLWFLDEAAGRGIRVFVDIPWPYHAALDGSARGRREARSRVELAVRDCRKHAGVFAFSVANELPPDLVRWSGTRGVERFIDELVDTVHQADPEAMGTFASFPSTEFLQASAPDFICFNLFLHELAAFEGYLARLQMLSNGKPLILGETGIDSLREGEPRQAEILGWQIESAARAGLAGIILFSFTDDWHRGGRDVTDWAFGLTDRQRNRKRAWSVVAARFGRSDAVALLPPQPPRVSVIVATWNGGRTLQACLASLARLEYPDYEIIVVDDGSTDNTPVIAAAFAQVRVIRQDHAGLSVARNTGIAAATGEVVAFTDDDCRADERWLTYLVADLLRGDFVGIGGHNLAPPEDSRVAAAVMAAPGGPSHVMLTDREAEHIPGCNMAFYRWALLAIGGFDPVFVAAGDDVDLCWRLQQRGWRIGFSPGGFVWHYRRPTIRAYLRQQRGYGGAEALLAEKHPDCFSAMGGSIWRGRIYSPTFRSLSLQRQVIYRGLFGSGMFQRLYQPSQATLLAVCTSLEYYALFLLPLTVLSMALPFLWPASLAGLAVPVSLCCVAAIQAELPRGKRAWWSRPLIGLLFLLQPVVRGWARYQRRLTSHSLRPTTFRRVDLPALELQRGRKSVLRFWSDGRVDRFGLLAGLLQRLHEEGWEWQPDAGWGESDAEVAGRRWGYVRVVTASEPLPGGRLVLHCRLSAHWSLLASWGLAFTATAALLLVAAYVGQQRWILLTLLFPALLWARVEQECRGLIRLIGAVLQQQAAGMQLIRVDPHKPDQAASPQPPPAAADRI